MINRGDKIAAGFCAIVSKAEVAESIIDTSLCCMDMSGVLGMEPEVVEPE